MVAWATDHWFLTFLLAALAIEAVAEVGKAFARRSRQ